MSRSFHNRRQMHLAETKAWLRSGGAAVDLRRTSNTEHPASQGYAGTSPTSNIEVAEKAEEKNCEFGIENCELKNAETRGDGHD